MNRNRFRKSMDITVNAFDLIDIPAKFIGINAIGTTFYRNLEC